MKRRLWNKVAHDSCLCCVSLTLILWPYPSCRPSIMNRCCKTQFGGGWRRSDRREPAGVAPCLLFTCTPLTFEDHDLCTLRLHVWAQTVRREVWAGRWAGLSHVLVCPGTLGDALEPFVRTFLQTVTGELPTIQREPRGVKRCPGELTLGQNTWLYLFSV